MANTDQEKFRLVSSSISQEGKLPRKYTEEGQGTKKNLSPPLEWYNIPHGTQSLALVVEVYEAPDATATNMVVPWTTWVVCDIPPTVKGLPEGFSGKEQQMGGEYAEIREGHNDHKVPGWRGPKMPTHGHHYHFTLYALDQQIKLGNKITKEKLLERMEGHVLGEASLTAIF